MNPIFQRNSLFCRVGRVLLIALAAAFALLTALSLIACFSFVHPVSTLMLGNMITARPYQRDWVPLSEISPNLVRAVMMAEDARFCVHYGVDWAALSRAAEDDGRRGASTITMQTVKNLYFTNHRSYLRKAAEIPAALWVDLLLPKRRIMEIYLNIAEWGHHIYGAEAASRTYFGISARHLTPHQAALLAVTLPSPIKRNPRRLTAAMARRAAVIERRMLSAAPYTACLR